MQIIQLLGKIDTQTVWSELTEHIPLTLTHPSLFLLYWFICKHTHKHTHTHSPLFLLNDRKRRGRAERGVAVRLVSGFWATWLAAGSIWSCEEGLPTLTSEETNICLKESKREGEEKILISLQTHREIKVGKTYPSKGCRVGCKMEIFPKLTDPAGC